MLHWGGSSLASLNASGYNSQVVGSSATLMLDNTGSGAVQQAMTILYPYCVGKNGAAPTSGCTPYGTASGSSYTVGSGVLTQQSNCSAAVSHGGLIVSVVPESLVLTNGAYSASGATSPDVITSNGQYNGIPQTAGHIVINIDTDPNGMVDVTGNYYVEVTKMSAPSNTLISGAIDWIVNPIKIELNTITKSMYLGMLFTYTGQGLDGVDYTHPTSLMQTIYWSMVLYIVIYGLGFVIGIVPMTQMELVIRLAKVGLMLELLSPSSFYFFNNYLFTLFRDGRDQLMQLAVGAKYIGQGQSVFVFMDRSIGQFLSGPTWIKMAALVLHPIIGWVLFSMIVSALWWFTMASVEMVMAYIVAMIALSLLIALAPFFLICFLFNYTKKYFDAWVSHMVNFALQPVVLFAGVAMLNEIVVVMFYQTFAFATVKGCGLSTPSWLQWLTTCYFYGPQTASNDAAQAINQFNPLLRLTYGIILVIVVDMLHSFMTLAPGIVGQLTGENVQENIGASTGGAMTGMDQGLKGLVGQDDKSKGRRENTKEEGEAVSKRANEIQSKNTGKAD